VAPTFRPGARELREVFRVDDNIAIQALDRKDSVLLLSPGRTERHGFEYHPHIVFVRTGSEEKAYALHPPVQQSPESRKVEVP
jgi:hypothetical protein